MTPNDDSLGAAPTAPRPRILVVDDETKNRQLIEAILAPEGYRIESVASGPEALAAVGREAPDLILVDIMMPGMDGYRLLSALKGGDATKQIPVVLVSALDDANTQAHGKNLGADGFLAKPIGRANLSALVRRMLGH